MSTTKKDRVTVADVSIARDVYGAYVVSAMVDGHRVARNYYGFTKRAASKLFRDEANGIGETAREVARVRGIIANGRDNTRGPNGEHKPDMTTCGACGRTWDDGRISSLTPTPSARCPFEYAHTHAPKES